MKVNERYCFDDASIDVDDMLDYTGKEVWNAVYTIQLGELIEYGIFDWSSPALDWSTAAYDEDQYKRVCDYFIQRFMYREISIEPYLEWAITLKRKLVFELMPKYMPLYVKTADGINPFSESDEYYKNRTIQSAYPETLLSDNADYITDGRDEEYEKEIEVRAAEKYVYFAREFKGIDELLLNELESMFISLYTANVNATW